MKNIAYRRLQANFPFFINFTRKFSDNLSKNPERPSEFREKKQFESILYIPYNTGVTEVIFNEPNKLNSLDIRMIKSLSRKVKQWCEFKETTATDTEMSDIEINNIYIPKVILMSGAGEKSFCAGGDITTLYDLKKKGNNNKKIKDFFRYEYLLDHNLTKMKPIQVAIWNGYVMGGGVGLSIHAPIRIATDNTLFAMPETSIGLFPDVGGTYFLPRLFGSKLNLSFYLGLTGDRIKGKDLANCGLATHYVPLDKMGTLKKEIIEGYYENNCYESLVQLVDKHSEIIFSESKFSFPNQDIIERIFKFDLTKPTIDNLEELIVRLEQMAVNSSELEIKWATQTLKILRSSSPLSIAITFEQIRRGLNIKSLEDAFNLESQLIAAFIEEPDSDFFEGVRAKLVEKDNKPNWKYKQFKDINMYDVINRYFYRAEILNIDPNLEPENEQEK